MPGFLAEYFASNTPKKGPGASTFARARPRLLCRRINSRTDLLRHYSRLTFEERFVALCVFSNSRFQSARTLLFRELRSRNVSLRGVACAALGHIGGRDVLQRLLRLLRGNPSAEWRINVVYALAHIRLQSPSKPLIDELIRVVENLSESADCRATAAEGIAFAVDYLKRSHALYRRGIQSLIAALHDPDPEVRFSVAQSLGILMERRALPELRVLAASDDAEYLHYGAVSRQARAAIRQILRSE